MVVELSLSVSEKHRLRVFVNMMLGGSMSLSAGRWRKLDNKDLHDFYSSLHIIRMINQWV